MKRIAVNGVQLAYEDQGRGRPVLLIHGFPLDHRIWQRQIEALAPVCRCIAPDLRGFGQSQVSQGVVDMRQLADDLHELLRQVAGDEAAVICGLSMGGYAAFEFWRNYSRQVRSLVLCDTRAAADTPEAAAARLQTAQRALREGVAFLVDAMLPRLLAPVTLEDRPGTAATLKEIILSCDPRGVAAVSRGMAQRADVTPLLPQIHCPALVIVGQHDAISPPAEMRCIAQAMPQATLVEIPDAGHLPPMEQPELFNRHLLAFLHEA